MTQDQMNFALNSELKLYYFSLIPTCFQWIFLWLIHFQPLSKNLPPNCYRSILYTLYILELENERLFLWIHGISQSNYTIFLTSAQNEQMLLEETDLATSDVVSKVKIVVRMTPLKESALVNTALLSCNVITYIYSFWAEVRNIV